MGYEHCWTVGEGSSHLCARWVLRTKTLRQRVPPASGGSKSPSSMPLPRRRRNIFIRLHFFTTRLELAFHLGCESMDCQAMTHNSAELQVLWVLDARGKGVELISRRDCRLYWTCTRRLETGSSRAKSRYRVAK